MDKKAPKLLLLVTGQTLPQVALSAGSFEAMFRRGLDASGQAYELKAVDITPLSPGDELLDLSGVDGVIMTGAAAMIAEATPWMNYGEELIRRMVGEGTPFLGVCFGHQLLGKAFGSDVGPNPLGYGIGTEAFTPKGAIPFPGAPSGSFPVNISHMDVVRSPGQRVEVLGSAPHDDCHMIQVGSKAFGVQFHPEFSADVVKGYIKARVDRIQAHHGEGAHLPRLKELQDTPESQSLLGSFAQLCRKE